MCLWRETVCRIWINGNYKMARFFTIITIKVRKKHQESRKLNNLKIKLKIFTRKSDDYFYDLTWPAAVSRPPTLGQNLKSLKLDLRARIYRTCF